MLTYGGAGNTLNARRVAEAALMAAEEQKELARAKDEEAAAGARVGTIDDAVRQSHARRAEVPTEPRNKEDDIFAIRCRVAPAPFFAGLRLTPSQQRRGRARGGRA